jgi:hypothetical protein
MQRLRGKNIITICNYFFLSIFLFIIFIIPVYAIDITLQWTPNSEPNLAGYRVFYREESQSYNYLDPYWETFDPICTICDLDETKTYYFVVRAFDTHGLESANSNEVLLIEGVPKNNPPVGSSGGGGGGGCFIATAAYGSLMAPHVKILREFRDRFLLNSCLGTTLVNLYYRYSPPIANVIAKYAHFRAVVRIGLLPLVGFSWATLRFGMIVTILFILILISSLIGFVILKKKANRKICLTF